MIFKINYIKLGGHLHCVLFSAPRPGTTYARCGDFVIGEDELKDMSQAMPGVSFHELTDFTAAMKNRN